jgi:hypothetical protein
MGDGTKPPGTSVPAWIRPNIPVTAPEERRRDLRDMDKPVITPTTPTRDARERVPYWKVGIDEPSALRTGRGGTIEQLPVSQLRPLFQVPQPATNPVRRDLRDMDREINPTPLTRDQRERYAWWQPLPMEQKTPRVGRVGPHLSGVLQPTITPQPAIAPQPSTPYNFMDAYKKSLEGRSDSAYLKSLGIDPGGGRGSIVNDLQYWNNGMGGSGTQGAGGSSGGWGSGGRRRRGGGGGGWGGWGGGGGWGSSGQYAPYEYPANMGLFSWNFKG